MANKDAYFFQHDSNASRDEKTISLRMKHGWSGYGLFWAILEKMRDSSEYQCAKDYNLIAFDLRTDAAVIKSIVEDFGLFVFTDCGKYFYSERLRNNMMYKEKKSEKAKKSAANRWGKDANVMRTHNERIANAEQTQCDGNAEAMLKKVKESKVKESKGDEDEISPPPPLKPDAHEEFRNRNFPRGNFFQEPTYSLELKTNFENGCDALADQLFVERAIRLGFNHIQISRSIGEFNEMRDSTGKKTDNGIEYRKHYFNWLNKNADRLRRQPTPDQQQAREDRSQQVLNKYKNLDYGSSQKLEG